MTDPGQFAARSAQAPFGITGSDLEVELPYYVCRGHQRARMQLTFHDLSSFERCTRGLQDAGLF